MERVDCQFDDPSSAKDVHAVQHAAHTIKGSGLNVGAFQLSAIAKKLEFTCKAQVGGQGQAGLFVRNSEADGLRKMMAHALTALLKVIEREKNVPISELMGGDSKAGAAPAHGGQKPRGA